MSFSEEKTFAGLTCSIQFRIPRTDYHFPLNSASPIASNYQKCRPIQGGIFDWTRLVTRKFPSHTPSPSGAGSTFGIGIQRRSLLLVSVRIWFQMHEHIPDTDEFFDHVIFDQVTDTMAFIN